MIVKIFAITDMVAHIQVQMLQIRLAQALLDRRNTQFCCTSTKVMVYASEWVKHKGFNKIGDFFPRDRERKTVIIKLLHSVDSFILLDCHNHLPLTF